MGNLISCVK